ncbi:hypothetical protein E2C01_034885 [Portunus trituberculatus]|uniref:Uncharacterized protein n=1 Tax=Portunus trituberculatus TaxID=210409 RepID=A0A5B7F6Y0_PORTR|nr:hypothetical protein [Portunus trituberculatus]
MHRLRRSQGDVFEYFLVDGEHITDPLQVTNIFHLHWQNIFRPQPLPVLGPSVAHINHIIDKIHQNLNNALPLNTIQL